MRENERERERERARESEYLGIFPERRRFQIFTALATAKDDRNDRGSKELRGMDGQHPGSSVSYFLLSLSLSLSLSRSDTWWR